MKKIIAIVLILLLTPALLFLSWVYFSTYHPAEIEEIVVKSRGEGALLKKGDKLKVLNWNVQYMAGKNYIFWYDLLDESGPDIRPKAEDLAATMDEVVRVIKDEDPDIILLQELHNGAKRTDHADQLEQLLDRLPPEYSHYSRAYYWKASYVPIKQIMGSVGMELAIISKYKLESAERHRLPIMPNNIIVRQFYFKRAILESTVKVEGGDDLVMMSTHLDAFAQGYTTMEEQVAKVDSLLTSLDTRGAQWFIGGDFNLLPGSEAYRRMKEKDRLYFKEESELKVLGDKYRMIPAYSDLNSPNYASWYTHFPNKPDVTGPDRTIDYLFYSEGLGVEDYYVRQADTLKISDHLPIIATFTVR